MDNWEKVDKALKAKVGEGKSHKLEFESKEQQKDKAVHAYKEEIRRMSVSNAFLSAALMPAAVLIQTHPASSISCILYYSNLIFQGSRKSSCL